MKRSPVLVLLPLLALGASCVAVRPLRAQAAAVKFPWTEGFEETTNGVPAGWSNDSSGELKVSLASDPRGAKEGMASWRISVPVWDAGAARVRRVGLPLHAGTSYGVEIWMRARDVTVPVTVAVEKADTRAPYFSKQFAVTPQWRRYALTGQADADDPNAALEISMPGTGLLSVDQLRMVEGELPLEPDPAPPAAAKGNRIYNSSFELGLDGWTIPEQVALVKGDCPEGEKFARWQPGRSPLEARPFLARPKQQYTISAFLRSQRPGAKAELAAVEVGNAFRGAQSFDLTGEWKRYSFTTTLPCERYARYFVTIGPAGEAHGIDVDAVQVEEGALTDYAPAAPIEVSPGLSRSMLFPERDEIIGVPVQIYAPGKVPEDASLRYRLMGFYDEPLGSDRLPLTAGMVRGEVPIRVRIPANGTMRLLAEVIVGRDVVSYGETMLTALPALHTTPDPDSFFGAHGSVGTPGEWHAPTVAARAGVRWWRLHDLGAYTAWAVAEPERGSFKWYDREIDALRSRGMTILGVLARTPGWAGADPGDDSNAATWPPAKLSDFSDYARSLASHYKGRIHAYEVWNEPWARNWWSGTPEQYVDLARAANQAVHAGDPAAKVVGGSLYAPQKEFIDRVLAKGLTSAVDAVSEHQYTDPEDVTFSFGGHDQVTLWTQGNRGKLNLAGGAKDALWNTEGGTPSPSFYTWLGAEDQAQAAARTVAKTLILTKANGVRHFFYYHVWSEAGGPRTFDWLYENNWALLDYDGSGKPTLGAYAGCAANLEGTVPAGRLETADLKAYAFQQGNETVIAAWSPTALTGPYQLVVKLNARAVKSYDLMNNMRGGKVGIGTITFSFRNEPVYIHVADTPAAAVLDALKNGTQPAPMPKAPKPADPAGPAQPAKPEDRK